MLSYRICGFLSIVLLVAAPSFGQDPNDVLNFDETAEGPWSDVDLTTLTIPKVSSGQIQLDGSITSAEYGGFEGVSVVPGENAWILDYAQAKDWQNPDDSSFTFYLAYDDDFLYIGVDAKDDVVRSNDPPASFWKDDAIEILIDPNNTRFDYNYDSVPTFFGGHIYFNYEGQFSEWEDDAPRADYRWSSLVEWNYGADAEIFGFGQETDTGWTVEVRFHKVNFIDDQTDFAWEQGQDMAFNIGLDDDDGSEMAIQYWWANRARAIGANPEHELWYLLLDEEIENKEFLDPDSPAAFWDIGINATGRLSPAGAGEIILGPPGTEVTNWSVY